MSDGREVVVLSVEAFGNVPGEAIDYGAKALKPVERTARAGGWRPLDN